MTAYEVSVSKLAAFEAGEEFDLESEFDLDAFQPQDDREDAADIV